MSQEIDKRLFPMVTARMIKRLTLRQTAKEVSALVGRPVSHQTIANIENGTWDTTDDIKTAICEVLDMAEFPKQRVVVT